MVCGNGLLIFQCTIIKRCLGFENEIVEERLNLAKATQVAFAAQGCGDRVELSLGDARTMQLNPSMNAMILNDKKFNPYTTSIILRN